MKKNLILLALLIALFIGITYLLNTFLPQKIRSEAQKFAHQNLNKDIEISEIKVSIIRGISLKGVSFYDRDEQKRKALQIENIQLMPYYPALISYKRITFALTLDGMYFSLIRNQDGKLNLPEIKFQPTPQKTSLIFIKKINLKRLNLDFEDKTVQFKKRFSNLSLTAHFTLLSKINFKLTLAPYLNIEGDYVLPSKHLKASGVFKDINLADFKTYLKGIELQEGLLDKAMVHIEGRDTYTLKGDFTLSQLALHKNGLEFKGAARFAAEIAFLPNNLTYTVDGSISEAQLNNLPAIKTLDDVATDFTLSNDKLIISSLTTNLSGNLIKAKAELTNFSQPNIYAEGSCQTTLPYLLNALKEIKNIPFEIESKGIVDIRFIVNGNLPKKEFDYTLNYTIKDAAIKDIQDITATGSVSKDKLLLAEGHLTYKNIPFDIAAQLENFVSPRISLKAKTIIFDAEAQGRYEKDSFVIEEMIVTAPHSRIVCKGTIAPKDKNTNLEGIGYLVFADVERIMEEFNMKYPALLTKLNPEGGLDIKFKAYGWQRLKEWEIKLAGMSDIFKLYGLKLHNLRLELLKNKNELTISPFVGDFGEGKFDFRLKLDYQNNKTIANLILNNIELAELRKQLNLKNKTLSGKLSLEAFVENQGLGQWDALDGAGKLLIRDGNIWEINFLRGLGEFLFIPDFEKIVFKDGLSDLTFKGDEIIFENIELKSFQMNLSGAGKISQKAELKFLLFPEFNPNLISASEGLRKIMTNILGKAGLVIEITGSLKKPAYKVKPAFTYPLKGIKDFLEGILHWIYGHSTVTRITTNCRRPAP